MGKATAQVDPDDVKGRRVDIRDGRIVVEYLTRAGDWVPWPENGTKRDTRHPAETAVEARRRAEEKLAEHEIYMARHRPPEPERTT